MMFFIVFTVLLLYGCRYSIQKIILSVIKLLQMTGVGEQ